MKKLVSFLFSVSILSAVLTSFAFAATEKTYSIEQGNFTVTIPDYFDYCLTKDSKPTDDYFSDFNADYDSTMEIFNQGYAIDAVTADIGSELVITAIADDTTSYNVYSNNDLENLESTIQQTFADSGIEVSDFNVIIINGNKYIKFSTTNDYQQFKVYGTQYGTIQNNTVISIDMRSYSTPMSSEQASILNDIVNSIVFTFPETTTTPATVSETSVSPSYNNTFVILTAFNFILTAACTLIPAWLIKRNSNNGQFKFSKRSALIGSILLCTVAAMIVCLIFGSTTFSSLGVLWYVAVYFIFRHGEERPATFKSSDIVQSPNSSCENSSEMIHATQNSLPSDGGYTKSESTESDSISSNKSQ